MHAGADPVIVPSLLLVEVASAVARATGDGAAALPYADAIAGPPHLTLVTLTAPLARQAAGLAAAHRLRGADAVYVAVARRYGTVLVTRDREQRTRGAAAVRCRTPQAVLSA
jgi:predicted nucleic acid-binding protein